jgi:hypothetical protein
MPASGSQPTPIYQLPDSLGAVAAKLNPDIATYQERANLLTRAQAFGAAYQSAVGDFPGDPEAGKTVPGSTLTYNSLTQVQRDLYDEWNEGASPTNPSIIPDNWPALLAANPGPVDGDNWWNWSYGQWGLDPAISADASMPQGTSFAIINGQVASIHGPTILD